MFWRIPVLASLAAAGLASGHQLATINPELWIQEAPVVLQEDLDQPEVLWTSEVSSDEFMDIAIDELLRISRTEELDLRVASVEVLGEIASDRAVATLGVILYENPHVEVRQTAAFVLGQIGTPQAIEAIAVAMEYEAEPSVRRAQMRAIALALPEADDVPTEEDLALGLLTLE